MDFNSLVRSFSWLLSGSFVLFSDFERGLFRGF